MRCGYQWKLQVRVNLPNGDMIGHTGDLDATIIGCTAVDDAVKVKKNYFSFYISAKGTPCSTI